MDRIFKIRCSAIGKIMGESKPKGGLSATCKTYLREWYANDCEPIRSKFIDKGNMVEHDSIELMTDVLNLGFVTKNEVRAEFEYMTGTPDIVTEDCIYDIKSAWNRKTLLDHTDEQIDSDYEWQLRGYMYLFGKKRAILFHALVDTPEECNFGEEVKYSHLPVNERWVAFEVKHDPDKIKEIEDKVIQCREWLEEYDKQIKNKLGKIN